MKLTRAVEALLVVLVVAFVAWQLTPPIWDYVRAPRYLTAGAHVGWTRAQVVARLGPPDHVAHAQREFAGDYPSWKPVPTASVEKEVLEYYHIPYKLYVYIDRHDRVTRIVMART